MRDNSDYMNFATPSQKFFEGFSNFPLVLHNPLVFKSLVLEETIVF